VAENRTLGMFSVRTVDEKVLAACGLYEAQQLHAAFPHLVVAGRDLVDPDRPGGQLCSGMIRNLEL
jgi:hypothetical protein